MSNVTVLSSAKLADLLANPYRVSRVPIGHFFVELDGDTFVSLQMKKASGEAADTIGSTGGGDVDVPTGHIPFGNSEGDGLTSTSSLFYDSAGKRLIAPQTWMYAKNEDPAIAAGFVQRTTEGPIAPGMNVNALWAVQGADDDDPTGIGFMSVGVVDVDGGLTSEFAFGVASAGELKAAFTIRPEVGNGLARIGLRLVPGPVGTHVYLRPQGGTNSSLRLAGLGTGSVSLWNAANTQHYLIVSDAGMGLNGHPGGPQPPPVAALADFDNTKISNPPTQQEVINALNLIVAAFNSLTAGLAGNGTIGMPP